jgi:hypothetical protein
MKCSRGKTPSKILLPHYTVNSCGVCVGSFDETTFSRKMNGPEMSAWMEHCVEEYGIHAVVALMHCLDCAKRLPKYRFYAFTCAARRGIYVPSHGVRMPHPQKMHKIQVQRLNNWRRIALTEWRKRHNLLISQTSAAVGADVYGLLYGGEVVSDRKWNKIKEAMLRYDNGGTDPWQ